MTIIDTFTGTVNFCKLKAIKKALTTMSIPEESASFILASIQILQNDDQQKYIKASFDACGPWHGFTILMNFQPHGHIEGELIYLQSNQSGGKITARISTTDSGYYIYGDMKTAGEKIREGFILIAENAPLLVTDYGLTTLNTTEKEEEEDMDLDEDDDETEEFYTDLIKQFIRIKDEKLFQCCQAYLIYVLCRLGYTISFETFKGVYSMFIQQKGKQQQVCILTSLSNRTWLPKIENIMPGALYILMDVHYSLSLPDIYVLTGRQLKKKLIKSKVLNARDPQLIIMRNIWDLLLDDSIPF